MKISSEEDNEEDDDIRKKVKLSFFLCGLVTAEWVGNTTKWVGLGLKYFN